MRRKNRPRLYTMTLLGGGTTSNTTYDYILLACGSDYRAYQTLRKREVFGVKFKTAVLFDFVERRGHLDRRTSPAYDSFKDMGVRCEIIRCSISDPSTCVKTLRGGTLHFTKDSVIAVDISCFTKPYFFALLKFLKEQEQVAHVTVLYTEPLSYLFSAGDYRSYHSTSGALSVMEMPGFPGSDTRTTNRLLVIMLGFDGELSSHVYDAIAPDELIVINGFPSYSPKFKDISLMNNEKLLGAGELSSASMEFSCADNPFEIFNLLELLRRQRPDSFFNVAPLGTKPMALGACLFALNTPGVRVVYPFPEEYAYQTTIDCWNSWAYEIPLDL